MKNLKLIATALGFFALLIIGMSATTDAGDPASVSMEMEDYWKPDFRVSRIATPGGLCQGSASKIRVTVTNSGMAGYRQDIPVTLFVSQPGAAPKSYLGKVRRGFAGRDNRGQSVWFHNVQIQNLNQVTMRAVVNHDKTIQETSFQNNSKLQRARVGKVCGALSAPALAGKTLSVRVFDSPTSSPRTGLYVEMRKGSTVRNGNTGNNGTAQIQDVPKGRYNLIVKQGTAVLESRSYYMPTYNASLNIILN